MRGRSGRSGSLGELILIIEVLIVHQHTGQSDSHSHVGSDDLSRKIRTQLTQRYIFPQQRKLMGSSAQISSGVCRCGSQEQVPEEGSGRFRRVPVCAGVGFGGRFRKVPEGSGVCWCRFRRQVPEGSGKSRCVVV